MSVRNITILGLLVVSLYPSAASDPDRSWLAAQLQQIQRVPERAGHHWEYVLVSNGFAYTLRTRRHDALYLNSSLGSEVKIASAVSGSNHPYDGDELYVTDAKGQEHKMGLVSVLTADAGCKK